MLTKNKKIKRKKSSLSLISASIDPISTYGKDLFKTSPDDRFTVFLCGPSIRARKNSGARVRRELARRLKKEGIKVFLGEDDGLENLRKIFNINAQDNELEFIQHSCDVIVLVAASVGSFCELGLFSWHHAHAHGVIRKSGDKDFIVLIEKKYRDTASRKSYLNEGPARAVLGFGMVSYANFSASKFDSELDTIIKRILERRTTYKLDRRGRPAGKSEKSRVAPE